MSFQAGSFRISPQDAAIQSEFRHTIQRAIERIHKPAIQSIHPSPIPFAPSVVESDQKYEVDNESTKESQHVSIVEPEQEQKPATITFEDILGMDNMELEQLRREKTKWKLEKELLWENMYQLENTNRTLKKGKEELEHAMNNIVEASIKESDELRHELGHRHMEVFHWREEMKVFRESLVKQYVSTGAITPHPTYIDDVLQTIIDSIQEIEKTECIMNMFYCSLDEHKYGDTNCPSYVRTYAKMYLITNKNLYEIQGYYQGKSWLDRGNNTSSNSRAIAFEASSNHEYNPTKLQYGTFYRFNPISTICSNINWYTLSILINATKGNIGITTPSHYDPPNDPSPQCITLQQIAERYVKNIIELVTE